MIRTDWETEIKNPGQNVSGVIQNVAYLFYDKLGQEDASVNWHDACSAFLEYAQSHERFGNGNGEYRVPGVSLEEATTKTLNLYAFSYSLRKNTSSSQDWGRAVQSLARNIVGIKIPDL